MKKLLLMLALVLWAGSAFAAGTCVSTLGVEDAYDSNNFLNVRSITYVCTGDVSNGSYPATAFSADTMAKLKGWLLITGSALNGSTGPTASSTITLSTTNGGDILGGSGKTATVATAGLVSKFKPIVDTVYLTSGLVPITHDLNLQVTQAGSAVNGAIVILLFKFVR